MIDAVIKLADQLDLEKPGWRKTHILMHDNCPSFVTKECSTILSHLNIPTMLTSLASFQALVVEGLF